MSRNPFSRSSGTLTGRSAERSCGELESSISGKRPDSQVTGPSGLKQVFPLADKRSETLGQENRIKRFLENFIEPVGG